MPLTFSMYKRSVCGSSFKQNTWLKSRKTLKKQKHGEFVGIDPCAALHLICRGCEYHKAVKGRSTCLPAGH